MIISLLFLTLAKANPQPEFETLAALTNLQGNYARVARHLTTAPPPGYRTASPFLKADAMADVRVWMERVLRPTLYDTRPLYWRGIRYPDFDAIRFDRELPSADTIRYVDIIGAAGLHWRHAAPENVLTRQVARGKLVGLVHSALRHPSPAEPNIVDYLRSVDLPSGRKLWYGYVTLGENLGPDRRVLSPLDWHRSFLTFTDGRTSYLQWVLTDSTLPRATGGAKTPGGEASKRILRF